MSPKKASSVKGTGRKSASKASKGTKAVPKASPMQKGPEPAHGPNVGGHDTQAQIAQTPAPVDVPAEGRGVVEVAPPNVVPSPPAAPAVDHGQER